ncbi:MAG: HAD hydrolase family protein [Bacteroidales bacterium]|nr:HAD hydrolase family protein [Bacteroidales bacterium]
MSTTNIKGDLHKVKAFAFDVDGVLAPDTVILHPDGDMMRTMNIKDGYAIQYAIKKGFPIAFITGGKSKMIAERLSGLGVNHVYLASKDKLKDFNDFLEKNNILPTDVLYMGDDIPDYKIMSIVGFPTCPCDAAEEIKLIADYISDRRGGEGCVRDVIEQVLKIHGKWMDGDAFNW